MGISYKINKLRHYFRRGIWDYGHVSFKENARVYLAQRLYMVFRGLFMEKHWAYAAQLTFNTLMAIIPVFAIILAVGRGFGFEDYIIDWCNNLFASQPEVAGAVLKLAQSYIHYTHTGVIIGISFVFMLYSVISLFNNIEGVFNGIWGVEKDRRFDRTIVDYTAVIFLVPLVIVLFSGLSIFFYSVLGMLPDFQVLTPLVRRLINFLTPLLMLTVFFTMLYTFVPNTKVNISLVVVPALLAGLCIIGLQALYLYSQVVFTSYSIIYGSLAALPLLMLWLQLSWYICIGFAELSHANQELYEGHLYEDEQESIVEKIRKCAVVLNLICRRQERGGQPCTKGEVMKATHFSHPQITRCIGKLEQARLIIPVRMPDGTPAVVLKRDSDDISLGCMIDALLHAPRKGRHTRSHVQIAPEVRQIMEDLRRSYLETLDHIKVAEMVEGTENNPQPQKNDKS